MSSPTRRARRAAPVVLLLAALVGGCADSGPIAPGGGTGPGGDTTGTRPDVPTTDDALGLEAGATSSVDREITSAEPGQPVITAGDAGTIQANALEATGQDVAVGVVLSSERNSSDQLSVPPELDQVWLVWTTDGQEMGEVAVDPATLEVVDHTTYPIGTDESDGADVLADWDVQVGDAVADALEVRPGEVLVAMPPDSPANILLVGIRSADGTLGRVGIDTITGEVLNSVDVPDGEEEPTVLDNKPLRTEEPPTA